MIIRKRRKESTILYSSVRMQNIRIVWDYWSNSIGCTTHTVLEPPVFLICWEKSVYANHRTIQYHDMVWWIQWSPDSAKMKKEFRIILMDSNKRIACLQIMTRFDNRMYIQTFEFDIQTLLVCTRSFIEYNNTIRI